MGIRFLCPQGHQLHVKSFLAGRRGVCPECGAKLVIPHESTLAGRRPARNQRTQPQPPAVTSVTTPDFAEVDILLVDGDSAGSVSEHDPPLAPVTPPPIVHVDPSQSPRRSSRSRRNWWFILLLIATLAMLPLLIYVLRLQ